MRRDVNKMDEKFKLRLKLYPLNSDAAFSMRWDYHKRDVHYQAGGFAEAVSESVAKDFDRLYELFMCDPAIFGCVLARLIHDHLDAVANHNAK